MLILLLFNALVNYREPLDHKIDPRCFDHEYTHVWICFTDKAITTEQYPRAIEKLSRMIDARSLMRRKLRGNTVNYTDIPLCDEYIDEVIDQGGRLLYRSKWLNAASFIVKVTDLENIADLDFVYKITTVTHYKNNYDEQTTA